MKYLKILTKEFLIKEYVINEKSTVQIAKEVECSHTTINKYLKNNNIATRTRSEACSGIHTPGYVDGHCLKTYYCKEEGCDNLINWQTAIKGQGRCESCGAKERNKDPLNSGNYKHGETLKKHYCIDCAKKGIKTELSDYRVKRCRSCAEKNKWLNLEYRASQIKIMFAGQTISPNKPEKLLNKLLNNLLPKIYTFVGDGKLIVGGFVPDFVNKDNDKIIELYGDYWHNREDWSKRDQRRIIAYKNSNYKTLIIWEHEFKNPNKVKERILEFNKRN